MNLKNLDPSRQMDYLKMQQKANDPNTPEHERRKAEDVMYAIRDQSKSPYIANLREKMTQAIRNGDTALAEKIGEEAKKIDRNYHF